VLRVRESGAPEGVSLEGDAEGGALLSMHLARCLDAHLPLQTDGDPTPYKRWLSSIDFQATQSEYVHISRSADGQSLVIAFSAQHANLLIANIAEVLIDCEPGHHRHEEYYPGHFYLTEASVPVVVERI
jgi:hypothetical protein